MTAMNVRMLCYTYHTPTSLVKADLLSHAFQVIVSEMLNAWGPSGFERHISAMQREYAQRAAVIQAAAEEHLSGLAEWTRPAAGMFLWLRLLTVADADEILEKLKDVGVVVVPGIVL